MAATGRSFQKLFVGNLPWSVGHAELKQYFQEFGRVISANVIFDKNTGCSKGYGFVVFNSNKALTNLEQKQRHVIEGQNINYSPSNA